MKKLKSGVARHEYFYKPILRHRSYCLVCLDVEFDEAAEFIRRFLRHTSFRTRTQRMGKVVRVRSSNVSQWQVDRRGEQLLLWI